MTRLIDPSLQKLSFIMAEMGDMVIESITLAIDSYLDGTNTKDKVLQLSDAIRSKYFEVEDLTFDMLLKFQPVADDFRLIR
jgi:phosphate transport system protein